MKTKRIQRATASLLILLAAGLIAGCGILKGPAPAGKTTPTAASTPGAKAAVPTSVSGAASQPTTTEMVSEDGTLTVHTATLAPTKPANPGALKGMPASLRKLGNLRAAPGTDAEVLAVLDAGTQVGILGVTPSLSWALVSAPGGVEAWVYFGNLEISGDQKDIIRVEPTATPAN